MSDKAELKRKKKKKKLEEWREWKWKERIKRQTSKLLAGFFLEASEQSWSVFMQPNYLSPTITGDEPAKLWLWLRWRHCLLKQALREKKKQTS